MDAPEIARPGLEWFNVAAPLPIASLRGRIVILDFWTEGCINCIQIIPTLRRVEERWPDKVVVIGVHSPKFANEKRAASVRDAIERYDIRHPIIHDPEMTIWRAYGVQAWPTLVVIDVAISADHHQRRPCLHAGCAPDRHLRIVNNRMPDVVAADRVLDAGRSFLVGELRRVNAYDDYFVGILFFDAAQRWNYLDAVDAAFRPEIENHDAP